MREMTGRARLEDSVRAVATLRVGRVVRTQTSILSALFLAHALLGSACLKMGTSSGTRDSGQSRLMDQSFAGQNRCNPDDHKRPFIIEWDATDMSSFEAHAANDIVVVRYQGCSLEVLDECKNDSVRGATGAYRPPEWTSGSLETLDISNEGELFAKLPLGQASLGGRLRGGEAFRMEYYVAGTRHATRDTLYHDDIADNVGCEGATHFVYAYNLGAFALASTNELATEVGGSFFGFGAGAKSRSMNSAEKKGGDLAMCRSDSATEVNGCKAPIRLTLRKIRDGEDPTKAAERAPDTKTSLNAAGRIASKLEMSDAARAHHDAAMEKMYAGDGKGCLAEWNMHAKLDPKHPSTDPKQPYAAWRANCLMLAGKCDAGKQLARKYYASTMEREWGPEQVDKIVQSIATQYCQGKMSDRDALLRALAELQKGAYWTKQSAASCEANWRSVTKLRGKVKPKNEEDMDILHIDAQLYNTVPACFARAGDCARAWAAFQEVDRKLHPTLHAGETADQHAEHTERLRAQFEDDKKKCKGK